MAKTEHYYTRFEEDRFYHIYNRSIDKRPLFKNEDNFTFFLKRYNEYLSCVIDTYAYCLLGNHFHFLVKIKSGAALAYFQELSKPRYAPVKEQSVNDMVSGQFKKFFQSYAMAFNKQHQRTGTLFQTPFKRSLINNDAYFTQIVYYIHSNPQHHSLIADFRKWKWSSYNGILLDKATKIKREEVLDWFGGRDAFIEYHSLVQKTMSEAILAFDE